MDKEKKRKFHLVFGIGWKIALIIIGLGWLISAVFGFMENLKK